MTLSPVEEREKHHREIQLEIAKTQRSIAGLQKELDYCQRCLEIEREYLTKLDVISREFKGKRE